MPWSKFLGCWLFAYFFNIFERQFGLTLSIALRICQLGSQKEGLNHDKKTRKISFIANLFTFSFLRLSLFNREVKKKRLEMQYVCKFSSSNDISWEHHQSSDIRTVYLSYVMNDNHWRH